MPSVFGNLTNLERLSLGACAATGLSAVTISKLVGLTRLNLRDQTRLTGKVPQEAGEAGGAVGDVHGQQSADRVLSLTLLAPPCRPPGAGTSGSNYFNGPPRRGSVPCITLSDPKLLSRQGGTASPTTVL